MLTLEIAPNPNCDAVELRVFHELEPPRVVSRIRLERPGEEGTPHWCVVTGWTVDGAPCPALARKVDDSGEGVVMLVSGGDAGLRLQRADAPTAWRLESPAQWGIPFLLMADAQDLQYEESNMPRGATPRRPSD